MTQYHPTGRSEWYIQGNRNHRLDGPAFIRYGADDAIEEIGFHVHGKRYSEEKFALLREALDSGAPEEWAIAYVEGKAS